MSSVVPSAAAAAPQGWLFEPVGDPAGNAFRPTDWTRGPWNPEFLHGCPVGALFAHLAEREKPSAEFLPARLTIDLYSAVPCTPLTGRSAVVKSSSRLRVIDIELLAGATAMARATVLFLRRTSDESPVATVADPMRFGPDEAIPVPWVDRDPGGPSRFYYEVEVRRVTEGDAGLPYQIWARHRFELMPGVPMSPFVRIGAYGDYVNGMGMKSRRPRKLLINSDIDIRLFREPETEWIGIQTVGRGDAAGVASSSVNLHDERGLIGHITASCIANEMRPGNLFGRKTP